MPKKAYWIGRAEAVVVNAEKSALAVGALVRKAGESAIRAIDQEIEAFYSKYSKKGKISLAEARSILAPYEMREFKAKQKAYAEMFARNPEAILNSDKARAEAEAYSKRLYITKLDSLKANIMSRVSQVALSYEGDLNTSMRHTFENSFYGTMYNTQIGVGMGFDFNQPGDKLFRQAVNTKHLGGDYSAAIWKDRNALATQLDFLLAREFVSGKGSRQVATTLRSTLQTMYGGKVTQAHAERLIRTEINFIANQGTLNAYKETGFLDMYEYTATLDNRTSPVCQGLDGIKVPLSEAIAGVNLPPMHANCRSTTIPYFPDDDISKTVTDRVARNAEGRSVKLGQNITYPEWVDQYGSDTYKQQPHRPNPTPQANP